MARSIGPRAIPWLLAAAPWVTIPVGLYVVRSAWLALLLYHACMLAGLAACRRHWSPAAARRGFAAGPAVPWIGGALALGPALVLARSVIGIDPDVPRQLVRVGLGGSSWPVFAAYYGLFHPVLEEVYWRGLVAGRFGQPVASDLAYGGYHGVVLLAFAGWPWAILAAVLLAAIGAAWRRLAGARGGLALPVLSHLAGDLSFVAGVEVLRRAAGG